MWVSRWLAKQGLRKPQTNVLRGQWLEKWDGAPTPRATIILGSLFAGIFVFGVSGPLDAPVSMFSILCGVLASALISSSLLLIESRSERRGLIALSHASDFPLGTLFEMTIDDLKKMARTRLQSLGSEVHRLQQEGHKEEADVVRKSFGEAYGVYVRWSLISDNGWGVYFPQPTSAT
ncbi:MAG: hypothetical protein A3B31_01920 [Candidatus Komeilibacteria bacterium RIFCSPLOWO2_01_FULL_53_11]|uniref:Uncharacterized protein n=1 Tax=Candidatus Komeilibacteria bacterium RIFCSPLOWO2_01_FULL_53_11 TaxID=1798552 RepID=A0A1G2BUN2_9BACT|nr:MAG: hypothetical protein A3B31_01920 [Candidatus Komeilibacteria bacterium RIFCSPLOWO2_01_FULL_53_11]